MKHLAALALFAVAAASAAAEPVAEKAEPRMTAASSSALPPGAILLKKATIADPGVIAAMDALNIFIPDGWTTSGGIKPARDMCSELFAVDWSATSPDGNSSVFIFPTEGWQASTTPMQSNCQMATFSNAQQYLTAKVSFMFPGARVTNYRPREDLVGAASAHARDIDTAARQMGLGLQSWADGGEAEFTFTRDGTAMKGTVAVTAIFYMSSLYNPMGGPPLQSLTGGTLGTFGAVAPADRFNADLPEAVRRSVTPNAEWLQKLFVLKQQYGQIAAQGTEERAAMIVAGGAAATRQNIETFRKMADATRANGMPDPVSSGADTSVSSRYSNESTDERIQRESIEAVRGVETYLDPVDGSAVQLDATYDNAWRVTNQDAYILTNDPNFNPGLYDIQATQLQVIK